MSLIAAAYLISEQRIATLLADPLRVYEVLDGAYNDPTAGFVDLDKAWQCLHYLLTGRREDGDPPLNFIAAGGTPVGDDLGYGPARLFKPVEVASIANALARVDPAGLRLRFDPKKLEQLDIYPGGWSRLNLRSDYELGYYFGPLEELKRLVERGRAEGAGMIVWIS